MELFKPIALVTQVVVLAVTGVAFLIWMGVNNWQDKPGSTIGGIFILLAVLQGVYSFVWWRQVKKEECLYEVADMAESDRHQMKLASMTESKA